MSPHILSPLSLVRDSLCLSDSRENVFPQTGSQGAGRETPPPAMSECVHLSSEFIHQLPPLPSAVFSFCQFLEDWQETVSLQAITVYFKTLQGLKRSLVPLIHSSESLFIVFANDVIPHRKTKCTSSHVTHCPKPSHLLPYTDL